MSSQQINLGHEIREISYLYLKSSKNNIDIAPIGAARVPTMGGEVSHRRAPWSGWASPQRWKLVIFRPLDFRRAPLETRLGPLEPRMGPPRLKLTLVGPQGLPKPVKCLFSLNFDSDWSSIRMLHDHLCNSTEC